MLAALLTARRPCSRKRLCHVCWTWFGRNFCLRRSLPQSRVHRPREAKAAAESMQQSHSSAKVDMPPAPFQLPNQRQARQCLLYMLVSTKDRSERMHGARSQAGLREDCSFSAFAGLYFPAYACRLFQRVLPLDSFARGLHTVSSCRLQFRPFNSDRYVMSNSDSAWKPAHERNVPNSAIQGSWP